MASVEREQDRTARELALGFRDRVERRERAPARSGRRHRTRSSPRNRSAAVLPCRSTAAAGSGRRPIANDRWRARSIANPRARRSGCRFPTTFERIWAPRGSRPLSASVTNGKRPRPDATGAVRRRCPQASRPATVRASRRASRASSRQPGLAARRAAARRRRRARSPPPARGRRHPVPTRSGRPSPSTSASASCTEPARPAVPATADDAHAPDEARSHRAMPSGPLV